MGKKSFDGFSGLLLLPCDQIHTFFMKMNIDAVYLDHNMKVISVMPCIDTEKSCRRSKMPGQFWNCRREWLISTVFGLGIFFRL